MKQLGNLAVVCANKENVLLQIQNGEVCVHYGEGPERVTVTAKWDDDEAISAIVYELNFGKGVTQRKESNTEGYDKKDFGSPARSNAEWDEMLALAKVISDYNMQNGGINERYLPYVREVAMAIYDEGYRKVMPSEN